MILRVQSSSLNEDIIDEAWKVGTQWLNYIKVMILRVQNSSLNEDTIDEIRSEGTL